MTDAQHEWREALIFRVGCCEICSNDRIDELACHEIARGIHRQNALTSACAILVVCWRCHKRVHEGMSVAEQLAYLLLKRDSCFDIEAYYKLTGRRWPDLADITHAHARMWAAINSNLRGG